MITPSVNSEQWTVESPVPFVSCEGSYGFTQDGHPRLERSVRETESTCPTPPPCSSPPGFPIRGR